MKPLIVILATMLALAGCSSSGSSGSGPSCDASCVSTTFQGAGDAGNTDAYPPTSLAGLDQLASRGDASVLTALRQITRPFGSCQRPNFYALAPVALTGRALARDEAAYMQQAGGFSVSGDCSSFLYVFHSRSEVAAGGYTAGAILNDGEIDVYTSAVGSAPAFSVQP